MDKVKKEGLEMRYVYVCLLVFVLYFTQIEQTFALQNISAQNAVLIHQDTGEILFEKNAKQKESIASITKVMTAIIAIESGLLEKETTVSRKAIYTEGSSIYLEEGQKVKIRDLLYGLMLRSGNDAAIAISEEVGSSEQGFVYLMNEKARWLGMDETHFSNPHGLESENHYSTAYDMAKLMRYAMTNETFKEISGAKSYKPRHMTYEWGNKNKLLTEKYKHCTGGKTGYTEKAGRTLLTTAKKDEGELIAVTLNAPDDWNDHIKMYDLGFQKLAKSSMGDATEPTFAKIALSFFQQMLEVR